MDWCIGESWVRWWRGFGSVEIGWLLMSSMMGRSRSLMMGQMWCDVGGVVGGIDLVDSWVKWFRRSGFCVYFAVRHGLIFIFWVQMGWMWQ